MEDNDQSIQQHAEKNKHVLQKYINIFNSSPNNSQHLQHQHPDHQVLQHNRGQGVRKSHMIKKIPYRQNSSFLSLILIFLVLLAIIFLVIDLKQEYNAEVQSKQQQKYQCLSKYKQNQCQDPVQILEENCRKWRQCFERDPVAETKLSVLFVKIISSFIQTFVQTLGFVGLGIVLVFLVAYWCRPYTHEQHHIKYQ